MEVPITPSRQGSQNADYTRPLDPPSPGIGGRPPKRTQVEHTTAPEPLSHSGGARKTTATATALREGIEACFRETQRTTEILGEFARRTDSFASQYTSQKDQQIAEAISKAVARSLIDYFKGSYGSTRPHNSLGPSSASSNASYAMAVKTPSNDKANGPIGRPIPKTTPTKQHQQKSREDHRVLVTLPAPITKRAEAYAIRERLSKEIDGITMSNIPTVSPTKSGWAIIPTDLATRDILLANQDTVLEVMQGYQVAVPEAWVDYVVLSVPSSFHGAFEEVFVTRELMQEEVFRQTGETSVRCDMARRGADPSTGKASWIISFKKKVRPFHIFNTWSRARLIEKKPRITRHAPGCQGWCNPVKCTKEPLCGRCGAKVRGHDGPAGDNCTHEARCANCHGPHIASHENCPARPAVKDGKIIKPTKAQLGRIRQAAYAVRKAGAKDSSYQEGTSSSTATSLARRSSSSTPSTRGGAAPNSSSPSPESPLSTQSYQGIKRGRGQRVAEYENAGLSNTTPSPPESTHALNASGRGQRSAAPKHSLNNVQLSRDMWAKQKEKAAASTAMNPFSPLVEKPTTSREPELELSDDEMTNSPTH
jgi:hypothetical protein